MQIDMYQQIACSELLGEKRLWNTRKTFRIFVVIRFTEFCLLKIPFSSAWEDVQNYSLWVYNIRYESFRSSLIRPSHYFQSNVL
jgi:hypothetical protein